MGLFLFYFLIICQCEGQVKLPLPYEYLMSVRFQYPVVLRPICLPVVDDCVSELYMILFPTTYYGTQCAPQCPLAYGMFKL